MFEWRTMLYPSTLSLSECGTLVCVLTLSLETTALNEAAWRKRSCLGEASKFIFLFWRLPLFCSMQLIIQAIENIGIITMWVRGRSSRKLAATKCIINSCYPRLYVISIVGRLPWIIKLEIWPISAIWIKLSGSADFQVGSKETRRKGTIFVRETWWWRKDYSDSKWSHWSTHCESSDCI